MTHASGDPLSAHHERGRPDPPSHTQLGTCLLSTCCLRPLPSFPRIYHCIFPAHPHSFTQHQTPSTKHILFRLTDRRSYIILLHRYDTTVSPFPLTSHPSEPCRLHISSYRAPDLVAEASAQSALHLIITRLPPPASRLLPLPARAERVARCIHHHELLQRLLPGLRQADQRHRLLLADLQVVGDSPPISTRITSIHTLQVGATALHGTHTDPHRTPARHRLLVIPAISLHHIICQVQHAHAFAQQVTLPNLPDLDRDKPVAVRQPAVRASP